MLPGDRDKSIGDSGQHPIQPADAVWPSGRMKCREHNGNVCQPGGQSSPKHFVAGTDRNHGIDSLVEKNPSQTQEDRTIQFVTDQPIKNRNFLGQHVPQYISLFQAADDWLNPAAIEAANQVDQQRFGPPNGHTG
jgi:hypothetical protein